MASQFLRFFPPPRLSWIVAALLALAGAVPALISSKLVIAAQPSAAMAGQPLTLRSDVQEANSITGVITARGNVQITYPARQIQATAVQAQYYVRERRIVLSGDVYVLQNGNSLRGETITYLIDEGRFVALPDQGRQVESIYIVQDASPTPSPSPSPSALPSFNPKPEFKEPMSNP